MMQVQDRKVFLNGVVSVFWGHARECGPDIFTEYAEETYRMLMDEDSHSRLFQHEDTVAGVVLTIRVEVAQKEATMKIKILRSGGTWQDAAQLGEAVRRIQIYQQLVDRMERHFQM